MNSIEAYKLLVELINQGLISYSEAANILGSVDFKEQVAKYNNMRSDEYWLEDDK